MTSKGPGLYEFLIEAELQQYYNGMKNDLKIQNVPQLKYVAEDDLHQIGMSKPEMRRLKKYFQKYCPQTYLSKFKKMILAKKDDVLKAAISLPEERQDGHSVKVPSKHIIPTEAITVNKELGMGEFGVVQQGVWTNEDGERIQVAIKCLSRERMQNNPIEFLKEAAIMHTIDHEHIVRLYGVVLDTSSLMLVTELAPLRSLLECLKEPSLRQSFSVLTICDFAVQICDGMSYLESKRLIHRDLAARNILVFSKNKVKISDFGLSRALGVGKDYYQTNFNVNLKLPIAWCAPECINYLRFTSASDVWAYGVTLWEMFSYGFQPWAALTGVQILEAIDEPNFQHLEQPECCPKECYSLMLKCWQHDPGKRPRFADLLEILPECKPEQVQVIQESGDEPGKVKREQLAYRVGDVITVVDKKPMPDMPHVWKGVLNSGKTGLFNPAYTITYLGANLPSAKPNFQRGDGKNVYSSKRRLRPDMISSPQGDLKHTGHVGLDGAYFGDVAFLGDKHHQLPKQIVTPYKPQEDQPESCLTRTSSDGSDRVPLLVKTEPKKVEHPHPWDSLSSSSSARKSLVDHEYHEISDEENGVDSPHFEKSFDLGPSLMDEVFRALGSTSGAPSRAELDDAQRDEAHNAKNELKEIASRAVMRGDSGRATSRKQATVKPISAADQRTLDSAIAMANELASRSMLDLDLRSGNNGECSDHALDSPRTPSSPNKRKFSFKFSSGRGSPKAERRNFAEEAASISDIQSSLTEEAKEAYNTLIEKPALVEPPSTPPVFSPPPPSPGADSEDSNPLRMLRLGVPMRARVRGNKHQHTVPRNPVTGPPRLDRSKLPPPPVSPKPRFAKPPPLTIIDSNGTSCNGGNYNGDEEVPNPLPLPPRDRTRPSVPSRPRHQRKYPLVIPGGGPGANCVEEQMDEVDIADGVLDSPELQEEAEAPSKPPRTFNLDDSFESQIASEFDALDNIPEEDLPPGAPPPPPPPTSPPLDDELPASTPESPPSQPPIYKSSDHVSCEDLLEFALDRPDGRRTRGRSRGRDSDEVRIMQKVLGKERVGGDEACLAALDATDWDIHKAIKLARLQATLMSHQVATSAIAPGHALDSLEVCQWDDSRAAAYLLAVVRGDDDTTEV